MVLLMVHHFLDALRPYTMVQLPVLVEVAWFSLPGLTQDSPISPMCTVSYCLLRHIRGVCLPVGPMLAPLSQLSCMLMILNCLLTTSSGGST